MKSWRKLFGNNDYEDKTIRVENIPVTGHVPPDELKCCCRTLSNNKFGVGTVNCELSFFCPEKGAYYTHYNVCMHRLNEDKSKFLANPGEVKLHKIRCEEDALCPISKDQLIIKEKERLFEVDIPDGDVRSSWIDVEDDLPEANKTVMVWGYNPNKGSRPFVTMGSSLGESGVWLIFAPGSDSVQMVRGRVYKWQNLPKAP